MNTALIHHIEMRTPLIWVDSPEAFRVTEIVCAAAKGRPVYRMNAFDGLMVWFADQELWKRCLVPQGPENQELPCYDLQVAIVWIHKNHPLGTQSILVVDQAHENTVKSVLFLNELTNEFYGASDTDDFDRLHMQVVMVSSVDKIPPEIAPEVVRIPFGLPSPEELEDLADGISHGAPSTVEVDSMGALIRAGQGLSSLEFTRACLESIRQGGAVDPNYINEVKVNLIKAGGVLEIRRPSFTVDAIGGLDKAKNLLERIVWLWDNIDEAKAMNVTPIKRVLLVGIPGTGKSMFCEATAQSLGLDLAVAGVSKALSKWVGESEANMRNAFRQVKAMAPIVMWVDEFGRDMSGSGTANDSGTTDRVHGEFLTGLQELPDNVFLFAAANRIDALPPEMLRADRFDKIMFIGFPTATERADIFTKLLGPEESLTHDLEALARATNTFTGAEIKALIKTTRFNVVPELHRPITTADLVTAAPLMKGRVWNNHRDECLHMYQRAQTEWEWASSAQEAAADKVLNQQRSAPNTPPPANTSPFSHAVHHLANDSGLS